MRLADPHAELSIKNFKYVKNCTEMYLSKRKIQKIANFESFVNLEVLWINENEIESLDGLDTCVRIKYLYAQNNRIRKLEGSSLACFTFLKELRLYDNKLKDLHGTLAVLSKLHHLEDLDLFGNPLQKEESYRLQAIKAVPTLVVLDRHVITDEERAKAEKFRPITHDRNGSSQSSSSTRATKTKKAAVIAGAPPQEMSGTVKMLFKEVAATQREQKMKEREAIERELLELSNTQKALLASSSSAGNKPKQVGETVDNLDDWELAALRKRFHALEEKKNSGIKRDDVGVLLAYLSSWGYTLFGNSRQLSIAADLSMALKKLFPPDANINWADLIQCFGSRRLGCEIMTLDELNQKAAVCFDKSEVLQGLPADDVKRQQLAKESFELSQQAYHLQTLAEKLKPGMAAETSSDGSSSTRRGFVSTGDSTAVVVTPKTKYYVTSYTREGATAPSVSPPSMSFISKFHELKEQSAQVDSALAAKYKLQQKDYTKYLLKQTPQPAKLVKQNFHM